MARKKKLNSVQKRYLAHSMMIFIKEHSLDVEPVIVGIDSSERSPGISVIQGGEILYAETVNLTSSTYGPLQRAEIWSQRCLWVLNSYGPGVVAYEAINVAAKGINGIKSTSRSHGVFYTAINLFKGMSSAPLLIIPVNIGTIKGWTTGNGKADKSDVLKAVNEHFCTELSSEDESDSVGAAWVANELFEISKLYNSIEFNSSDVLKFINRNWTEDKCRFLYTTLSSLDCMKDTNHERYRKTKAYLKKI